MQYLIEKVNDANKSEMLEFLKQHENYTLFLLGNFENYGFKISEAPYAEQIYSAIQRRKSHAYITRCWFLIGWILKFMPNWIYNRI